MDDDSSLVSGLTPDGEGNISGTFAVPKGSSAAKHTVETVCTDPLYQATAYFTVTEEETTGTTGTTTDGQNNGGTTGDTGDTDGAVGSDGGTDSGGVGDTGDGDTAVPVAWVV